MSTTKYGTELDLVRQRRGTQGLFAALMARTKSVWRALRNRVEANSLHDLDDGQLADIGITRHDVMIALDRSGVTEDPTRLLAGAARHRSQTRFTRPAYR